MGAPKGNCNACKGGSKGSKRKMTVSKGSKKLLKTKRKGWYRFSLGNNSSSYLKGQSRNRQWHESIIPMETTKIRSRSRRKKK